jgi:hypothetical protein
VLQLRPPPVVVEPVRQWPARSTASPPARVPPAPAALPPTSAIDSMAVPLSLEILPQAPVPVAKPAAGGARSPQASAAAPALAPCPEPNSTPTLNFETTQTLRPLTPLELKGDGTLRWFVIQLSLADKAFDPDTVPNLDIFSLYRLYSVVEIVQGRPKHALRLGFFGEEIGARAVANYVAGYYEKPTIKRVSVAERERFSDQGIDARKDVGATGQHAAIEITSERVIRQKRLHGSP